MSNILIDWIVGFSSQCALSYSTISIATAFVCFVMALVLLMVRKEVLKEDRWLLFLGLAFGMFTLQYGGRSVAAWISSRYSKVAAGYIEAASQAIFSNLNSFFFLLAALALLYRLPSGWLKTRWQALVWLFAISSLFGFALQEPLNRYVDGILSAVCLLILSYAMYVSSGTRRRRGWPLLAGGIGYAGLQLVYVYAPTFRTWPRISTALNAAVEKYKSVAVLDPEKILDSALFALALAFKVGLFTAALLVIMRCLAAFASSRDVLKSMKTERGEFLGSGGIVQTLGESIGADTVALCFRLASTDLNQIQRFQWWSDPAHPDEAGIIKRPAPDQSIVGTTLVAPDEVISSSNVEEDPRFKGLDQGTLGPVRWFLSVPLRYQGAVIGSLNFAWKKTRWVISAFTASEVQRARQIGDFVTPVVQTERWLRAVGDLRGRLQHYAFSQQERDRGTFLPRVANQLHDMLAPLGTLVIVDFGFAAQWAFCEKGMGSSDDSKEKRSLGEVEKFFRNTINGLEAREEEAPLLLDRHPIGKIVLAAGDGHDPLDRPSLTQDKQQLNTIAALVRDVVFDLHRKRFSGIIHRLNRRLNEENVTLEAHWMQCVSEAVAEAGLREVVVSPNTSQVSRDKQPEVTIPRDLLRRTGDHGGYTIYKWQPTEGPEQSILELSLHSSEEVLFVAIPRANFGRELDAELPWKFFFDRLVGAADSTLVRIRAIDLEREAIQFEITDLLVHELQTPAAGFRLGAQALEGMLDDQNDRIRALLEGLKTSASTFVSLSSVILKPFRRDTRLSVPLLEVLESVERFYQPRLPAGSKKIELRVGPVIDDWVIHIPFHLAYFVLLSLIRNAKEAIETSEGDLIQISCEVGPTTLLLHVDDNGCGIPIQNEEEIWIDGWSSKKDGSGRGLPLARRVLRRHKGDLILARMMPAGVATRFTIIFPRELS
ncbi:MAG: GAF domain-containing sensor histidine kinase [Acidobacteria bacterium]|nr:GAF domain-containing sensor histidine kinase [Acidobacteriota bacterium]